MIGTIRCIGFLFGLTLCVNVFGQDISTIVCQDLEVGEKAWQDCILQKGKQYFEQGYGDSAMAVSNTLIPYAKENPLLEARRLYLNGLINLQLSKFDSTALLGQQAADLFLELGETQEAAKAYNITADGLRDDGQFEQSTEYYYKAIELASDVGADSLNAAIYLNLSIVFLYLEDRKRHQEYVWRAYETAKTYSDVNVLGRSSMALCQMYRNKAMVDSAEYFGKEALTYSMELDQPIMIGYAYLNLAHVEKDKGNWELGDAYYRRFISDDRIPTFDRARFLFFYGEYEMDRNRPLEAIQRYEQGLELARSVDGTNLQHTILSKLYPLYDRVNNFQKAYRAALEYISLTDTLYQKESIDRIQELNARYESSEKEKELQAQRIEVIQRTNQLYWLLGISIGLLLLAGTIYLGWRRRFTLNQRIHLQETELAEQKIKQLEQERKLVAIQAMVSGEEAERSRLARELHDGLGGMLSNLKLNLGRSAESKPDESIAMVDRASNELRRIAQNLMPESLARFGLIQALEDLVSEVQEHSGIQIDFQHFEVKEPFPQGILLPIYRIIQELLHNVVKHASAKEVLLQMIQRGDALFLTVEDDGIGIDPRVILGEGGIGYKSIRSRLDFIKGKLDVESQPKKGTTVNIEITIPDEEDSIIHSG